CVRRTSSYDCGCGFRGDLQGGGGKNGLTCDGCLKNGVWIIDHRLRDACDLRSRRAKCRRYGEVLLGEVEYGARAVDDERQDVVVWNYRRPYSGGCSALSEDGGAVGN